MIDLYLFYRGKARYLRRYLMIALFFYSYSIRASVPSAGLLASGLLLLI